MSSDEQHEPGTPPDDSSAGSDSFDTVFTGNLPMELPPAIEEEEEPDAWESAPTRAFSLLDSAPVPRPVNQELILTRPDTEPDTIFDAERNRRAPREMKIAREGADRPLPEGHIINERFEVRRRLGAGRVGTVYLVDDLRLKDKKALKLMHPALVDSPEASERFIAEIKTLQGLSHEQIVRVYDYGQTDPGGLSFFTMEYIDGVSLAQLLKKRGGRLPLDKGMGLMMQVLDTLIYAHQHGAHRHLTPVNIMVRPTGRIVILNFGLSTANSSSGLPAVPVPLGMDHFLAPEQRSDGRVGDCRSDIFAVGAILYQVLTGEIPLGDAEPPSLACDDVPAALDPVIMRCLAEDPAERFDSVAELKAALEKALRPRLDRALLVVIGLVAAGLAGAAAWYFGAR